MSIVWTVAGILVTALAAAVAYRVGWYAGSDEANAQRDRLDAIRQKAEAHRAELRAEAAASLARRRHPSIHHRPAVDEWLAENYGSRP